MTKCIKSNTLFLCVKCGFKNRSLNTQFTMKKRYGVIAASQVKEFKDKANKSFIDNNDIKEVVEKRKNTLIERYGVDHQLKLDFVKDKIKKTTIERYGVEHSSQSKEIREKTSKTNVEKYRKGCCVSM